MKENLVFYTQYLKIVIDASEVPSSKDDVDDVENALDFMAEKGIIQRHEDGNVYIGSEYVRMIEVI